VNAFTLRDFDAGFANCRAGLPGASLGWLNDYRESALAALKQQGLPGHKTENWKYTSVRALVTEAFAPAALTPVVLPTPLAPHRAVLVNGCFNASQSHLDALPVGVNVRGLADLLAIQPQSLQGRLGRLACLAEHPFAALNGAFVHDRLIHGIHVRCERDSRLRVLNFDLEGCLLRNDVVVELDAPGADCQLEGLYLVGEGAHVDNHIRIDHHAPGCRSRTYYKGILGKGGHGVFNGKVIVHPTGQKTDARQVNRNLLLSRDVEIDTKPELEIYADDVKCSHGCTCGELEAEPLFYLRSRGIDLPQARALLAQAFAREISDRLAEGVVTGFTRTAAR